MNASSPPVVGPADSYQLDSDEYDSEAGHSDMDEEEYDRIVEEAEEGYTPEEMEVLVADLKERGLVNFLRSYILQPPEGTNDGSRSLRKLLLGLGVVPPAHLRHPSIPDLHLLPYTKVVLSRVLRRRLKLPHVNTVDDALTLLEKAKNIIVLSGAGISTSCGIPDFRSATGLYAQLQEEGKYDLDDPQQMFDIHFFKEQPEVFYSFAKSIYPSNFTPSPCHRWIKLLEDKDKLLRNYTQNIDTLETLAGVKRVLQCHGSFATASCLRCKTRVPGPSIEPYIMRQEVPVCGICRKARDEEIAERKAMKARVKGKAKAGWEGDGNEDMDDEQGWGYGLPGIMKPDITFFGQALDSEFDTCLFTDREKVDLLLIIGTSLKVAPVNEVLAHIPHSVPQIFINLTPISHVQPDICLLGDADRIVSYLSSKLGWSIPPPPVVAGSPRSSTSPMSSSVNTDDMAFVSGVGPLSHIHQLVSKSELEARLRAAEGVGRMEVAGTDGSDSNNAAPSSGFVSGSATESPALTAAAAEPRDAGADYDTSQPAQSIASTVVGDGAVDQAVSNPASPNDRPSKRSRMVDQEGVPQ